jgi:hypothetical protein
MKAYSARAIPFLTGCLLILSIAACSPKIMASGRILDAETHQPIKDAAVAIRWLEGASAQGMEKAITFEAHQTRSDDKGVFQFPEYPEKDFIVGVYKKGYICWSNKDIFPASPKSTETNDFRRRIKHHFGDGMEIKLRPFEMGGSSRERHAGFTVMVATESTNTADGPFHQAIESEYRIWRESLRRDFKDQIGQKQVSATRPTAE